MAYYAALVPVVQLLEDIIHDRVLFPDFDELGKEPITKFLQEKFTQVQKSLDDYSSLSNGDHEGSDDLERRIRDVAYRAQDIIESRISEEKTKEPHTFKKSLYKLFRVKSPQHRPDDDQEVIYHEGLKQVEEEVDSILDELKRIKESYVKVVEDVGSGSSSSSSKFDQVVDDDDYVDSNAGSKQAPPTRSTTMVGFDEQLIAIKNQLCGESAKQLQTIPITGMGGIGKTTLARNIFVDKLIVGHFDIRAWVTVSQDYNTINMLRDILDSMGAVTQGSSRKMSTTQLSIDIHQQLINRRYLIIVDDVWSTNVLDDINRISPDNNNGSRIIITTRLSDVAAYATTSGSHLHQMQSLNEEESWHLFQEKVFAQAEERVCPPKLVDLGKSIVRNCRGLPLAIVVIAGVLSKAKRTQTDWNKIASNVNSIVAENDEHFSRIFSLSYNHLPHHLKPCFLYIGGFPEDHKIQASKLIKLWMAEGFLNNNNRILIEESSSSNKGRRRRSLEEVGEEYLEDLVKRNLILVTHKNKYNRKIEVCGIHDLLRDLCQERGRNENFFHFTDKYGKLPKDRKNNVRRACLYPYNESSWRIIRIEIPDLTARSILSFGKEHPSLIISVGRFKLLRVFDTLEIRFLSFPDKLFELFHLRYLALSIWPTSFTTTYIRISPLISQLQNLQTVIVKVYPVELSLPTEMWKMAQLRHVLIDSLDMSPPPPIVPFYAGGLCGENLQTLQKLTNFRLTEEAVAMFPNLKVLKVQYTKRVGNWKWEYINNLSNLRQLEELEIVHLSDAGDFPKTGFAFPENLKRLTLKRCKIPWERMGSVVGCLANLEQLKLINSTTGSKEWEPKEGEFQNLKYLEIYDKNLKYWRADETHFPRLVHLTLDNCWKLEEIPIGIGDIPTLQFIEVIYCSDSAANSARQIKQQQEDMGNDTLQFRIIDNLRKYIEDIFIQVRNQQG